MDPFKKILKISGEYADEINSPYYYEKNDYSKYNKVLKEIIYLVKKLKNENIFTSAKYVAEIFCNKFKINPSEAAVITQTAVIPPLSLVDPYQTIDFSEFVGTDPDILNYCFNHSQTTFHQSFINETNQQKRSCLFHEYLNDECIFHLSWQEDKQTHKKIKTPKIKRICSYFGKSGGCMHGKKCYYLHIK